MMKIRKYGIKQIHISIRFSSLIGQEENHRFFGVVVVVVIEKLIYIFTYNIKVSIVVLWSFYRKGITSFFFVFLVFVY